MGEETTEQGTQEAGNEIELALENSDESSGEDQSGADETAEETLEETEETTEEGGETGETEETEETEEEVEETNPLEAEVTSMKQMARAQAREIAQLKEKLANFDKASSLDDDEADGESKEENAAPTLEDYEKQLTNLHTSRRDAFTLMVDGMRNSKDYTDVDKVCTNDHVADIVDMAASNIAKEQGIDKVAASYMVELDLWSRANPYKVAYELIKKVHPNFQKAEETKEKPKAKKAKSSPSSVAKMGSGSGKGEEGYTAEKLDKMSEEELDAVPAKVYDKWLMGDL